MDKGTTSILSCRIIGPYFRVTSQTILSLSVVLAIFLNCALADKPRLWPSASGWKKIKTVDYLSKTCFYGKGLEPGTSPLNAGPDQKISECTIEKFSRLGYFAGRDFYAVLYFYPFQNVSDNPFAPKGANYAAVFTAPMGDEGFAPVLEFNMDGCWDSIWLPEIQQTEYGPWLKVQFSSSAMGCQPTNYYYLRNGNWEQVQFDTVSAALKQVAGKEYEELIDPFLAPETAVGENFKYVGSVRAGGDCMACSTGGTFKADLKFENGRVFFANGVYTPPTTFDLLDNIKSLKNYLTKHPEHIHDRAGDGETLLTAAAKFTDHDIIRLLLQYGADLTEKNAEGLTALDIAKERKDTELVEILSKAR